MVDMVLVMTVNPGFGGQAFIPDMVEKMTELDQIRQEKGYHYQIQVDGGIDNTTIRQCYDQGVDVFVSGSYVYKGDSNQAIASLRDACC